MDINKLARFAPVNKYLNKQLGYYADKLYRLSGDGLHVCEDAMTVVIVARKHYRIQWQSYPAISRKELTEALKLQKESDALPVVTQVVANKEIDGFDVKSIHFDEELAEHIASAWMLIPETELFTNTPEARQLLELNTPCGTLFFSQQHKRSHSVYKGGLIANLESYRHSAGLGEEYRGEQISTQQYPLYLWNALMAQPMRSLVAQSVLLGKGKINTNWLHGLYWGPLLGITLYIAIASAWQWGSLHMLQQQISDEKAGANQVLLQKRELDRLNGQIALFNREVTPARLTHPDWNLVGQAIEAGMVLDRVERNGSKMTIRGDADSANQVLTALSAAPQVVSVLFDGAVRKNRGRDNFTVRIQLKPVAGSEESQG